MERHSNSFADFSHPDAKAGGKGRRIIRGILIERVAPLSGSITRRIKGAVAMESAIYHLSDCKNGRGIQRAGTVTKHVAAQVADRFGFSLR
jgi:hypothetical protein